MKKQKQNYIDEVLEELADLEHKQWSHWFKYMRDNVFTVNMERWGIQANTPYSELSEKEKDSDRKWAKKVLNIFNKKLQEVEQRKVEEIREKIEDMAIWITDAESVRPEIRDRNNTIDEILNLKLLQTKGK